jgi:hypothetical protein
MPHKVYSKDNLSTAKNELKESEQYTTTTDTLLDKPAAAQKICLFAIVLR